MNTKHTKGPWKTGTFERTNKCYVVAGDKIIYEEVTDTIPAQPSPNARLIAAAPEMLEVLCRLNKELGSAGFGYGNSELDELAVEVSVFLRKVGG